jgi:hypothetical protein
VKAGDLVNFVSNSWVFESAAREYTNPGIVLKVNKGSNPFESAEVMWADGRVTREHNSYLSPVGTSIRGDKNEIR